MRGKCAVFAFLLLTAGAVIGMRGVRMSKKRRSFMLGLRERVGGVGVVARRHWGDVEEEG